MRTTEHTVRRAVAGLLGLGIGLATTACGHGGDTAGDAPATTAPRPSARTEVLPTPESSGTGRSGGDSQAAHPAKPVSTGDQAGPAKPPSGSDEDEPATTVYAELVGAGRATPFGHWLSYDQLTRLSGKAAIDYQRKRFPDEEPLSEYFLNQNPKLREITLAEDAVIRGTNQLGTGGSDPVRLTPEQLVDRMEGQSRALVKMVVRVVDGITVVVRLDELYRP